jgi:tRNA 2-thiouridine synthesizing protein A
VDAGAPGGYLARMETHETIDAVGLICPLPVLRLRKRLTELPPGATVVLEATDRAAMIDVPHFCAEAGHHLADTREAAGGRLLFTIVKG